MRLTCFLFLSLAVSACSKNNKSEGEQEPETGSYTGVYVEAGLRKDTINFTRGLIEYQPGLPGTKVAGYFFLEQKLETARGMELYPSRRYEYEKHGGELHFSAYGGPSRVKFKWLSYNKRFFIEKFFDRPGLATGLIFEKVE